MKIEIWQGHKIWEFIVGNRGPRKLLAASDGDL